MHSCRVLHARRVVRAQWAYASTGSCTGAGILRGRRYRHARQV